MSLLEQRRQAFERQFQLNEELRFKIALRQAKLMGIWSAQEKGLDRVRAAFEGQELADWAFDNPGEDALARRVANILASADLTPDPAHILAALKRTYRQARREIMEGR